MGSFETRFALGERSCVPQIHLGVRGKDQRRRQDGVSMNISVVSTEN